MLYMFLDWCVYCRSWFSLSWLVKMSTSDTLQAKCDWLGSPPRGMGVKLYHVWTFLVSPKEKICGSYSLVVCTTILFNNP